MENKTVIITGGNGGIGLNITESFAKSKYNIIVGARNDTGLEKRFPGQVRFVSIDVRNEKDHFHMVELAMDWTGRIDVYINNAGYSEWRPIEKIDESFFNNLIGTNLKGAFWGCKAAICNMQKGGIIINISSLAGKRGSSNNSMYCASKFGMNGLTQALAKEVGKRSIRINAVCPVLIPTDGLIEALKSPYSPAKGNIDGFLSDFAKSNSALGRMPTGSEIGDFCVFLASDAASAITGQCINVDCGVLPQ